MALLKFEDVYFVSMICLKVDRCHPAVLINWKWACLVLLCYGAFSFICASVAYSLIFVDIKDDLTKTCTDGIFIVMWAVVTVQCCVLLLFRAPLRKLIQMTQENFDMADSMPAEDQAIVTKYAYNGRWVSNVWLICYSLNFLLFAVKAFILSVYSFYIGQFQLVPIYDYTFPSPMDEVKYRLDVYSAIFAAQTYFAVYAVSSYVGFCPLGPIFILNTCAQLELMAKEIGTVFRESPYNSKHASKKISRIVENLQRIYRLNGKRAVGGPPTRWSNDQVAGIWWKQTAQDRSKRGALENAYSFSSGRSSAEMIGFEILKYVLLLHFQVVDSLKKGEVCFEYIAFIISTTLICYVPCYYSDLLMEKGEEFRLAIYRSGWESTYDRNARKSLLIMLTLAIRPISIHTIFRTLCLDAFAETCHQAYSLFNLLCAAWD